MASNVSENASELHRSGKLAPAEQRFLALLEAEANDYGEPPKVVGKAREAILADKPATYVDGVVARTAPALVSRVPGFARFATA